MAAFLLGGTMEEWRDVKGFERLYQVSSIGNVRTKEKSVSHSRNQAMKVRRKAKTMSTVDNGNGYLYVTLTKDGKRYNRYVHRLVAEAFIDNPDGLLEVDHINRIRNDNRIENLRWVNRQSNIENSKAHGPRPNHWLKPSSGERYIYKKDSKWIVQFQRRDLKVYKAFKLKREAIKYRDYIEREVMKNVG